MPNFENGYKGGRPKYQWSSASRSTHKEFIKQYPQFKVKYAIYNKIIRKLNEEYLLYLLETGDEIKLPYNFGSLGLSKMKLNYIVYKGKAPVDWVETKKQGKRVPLRNWHTEGYRCKWNWNRYRGQSLKVAEIWTFKMVKKASLLLRDYLMDREGNYLQKYQHSNKI